MNEFKGTRGWKISDSGHPDFDKCIVSQDGGSVCFISNWPQTCEADGALLESAPDLLEALIKLMNVYNDKGQLLTYDVNIARKAIEKALGKTN